MSPGSVTKIFINGRYLSQLTTGVQRVARELVRAIDELVSTGEIDARQYQFVILVPRNAQLDVRLRCIQVSRAGWLRGQLWEQFELPRYARDGWLVNFANTGPVFTRRQIVMIHDASVFAIPSAYSMPFRRWYQFLLPRLGDRAPAVLTVSNFSRDELARWVGVPPTKLHVVPNGSEQVLAVPADRAILARQKIGDRPYVLAVGSRSPHKNTRVLLRALDLLDPGCCDIVMAGGGNARIFGRVALSASPSVKEIGYVTDGELRALYESAACFVYPSLYEGFGLPPLEAMACGCPVIAARTAALPEVCGEAAIYFDPHDAAELARLIAMVLHDPELRAQLSKRGVEQASRFSWLESARAVVRVLDEVTAR